MSKTIITIEIETTNSTTKKVIKVNENMIVKNEINSLFLFQDNDNFVNILKLILIEIYSGNNFTEKSNG
mgnify:CR=1 FL=1